MENHVATVRANKHIEWIDLLRSFAICCVVLVHTTETVYKVSDVEFFSENLLRTQIFVTTLMTIGRLGVPVFFLISGYLLLDREYDARSCVKFWKRNLLGLFLSTEIWIILYELFLTFYCGESFDGIMLLKEMLFVQSMQERVGHIWYMFVILGLYVFVPFVAVILQKFENKIFFFPMLLLFGYLFVLPLINLILGCNGQEFLKNQLSLDYGGGIYGFMLILGYFLKGGLFQKIRSKYLVVIGGASFLMAIRVYFVAYKNAFTGIFNNNLYNCAFLLIAVVCIFLLVSRINKLPNANLLKNLATCSFGIYLIHWPIRRILTDYISLYSRVGKVAIVALLTLLISWGVVWICSRMPAVSRVLFFIR